MKDIRILIMVKTSFTTAPTSTTVSGTSSLRCIKMVGSGSAWVAPTVKHPALDFVQVMMAGL